MLKGIGEWFYWHWESLLFWTIILVIAMCGLMCVKVWKDAPPRTEQIRILAVGKLINIRATGSFNIYDTELKFEDGSMLCVTYSFSRTNNLKEGLHYKIWDSSFYGYRCKLLEKEKK